MDGLGCPLAPPQHHRSTTAVAAGRAAEGGSGATGAGFRVRSISLGRWKPWPVLGVDLKPCLYSVRLQAYRQHRAMRRSYGCCLLAVRYTH